MKKFTFLLFIAFTFFAVNKSISQQVEIVGNAISGQTTSVFNVDGTDLQNITLYAVYLGVDAPVSPTINFADPGADEVGDVPYQSADVYQTTFTDTANFVYYKADFDGLDADAGNQTITVVASDVDHTHSFYAFVERNDPDADYYSVWDDTHVFYYHYGQDETYTYSLALQASTTNRDITVSIPFSGVDSHPVLTDRKAVVEVESGGVVVGNTFSFNNIGDFFHIETLTLTNVPFDATTVEISVSSLEPVDENDPGGDSFMTGGALIDVINYDDGGCTYTQGYWKTHSVYGPAAHPDDTWNLLPDLDGDPDNNGPDEGFYFSGKTYYEVFWTAPRGNKYYSLAHQFMAAQLNILGGADPSAIQTEMTAVLALFDDPINTPQYVKSKKSLNKLFGSYIGALTDYNEGTTGPGHCDDGSEEEGDDNKSTTANFNTNDASLVIYPNPVSNYGNIDFVAEQDASTTVEIYNLVGSRVDILFNDYVKAGSKTSLNFNANKYPKGMYILYIRNGSSVYKEKISIVK